MAAAKRYGCRRFSDAIAKRFSSNNRKAAIPINGTITMESAHINGEAQMRQCVFQRDRIVVVAFLHLVDE